MHHLFTRSRHLFFICLLFSYLLAPFTAQAETASYRILVDQRSTRVSIQSTESSQVLSHITLPENAMMIQAKTLPNHPEGVVAVLYMHNNKGWFALYTPQGKQLRTKQVFRSSSVRFLQSIQLKSLQTHPRGYRLAITGLKYNTLTQQEYFVHKILLLTTDRFETASAHKKIVKVKAPTDTDAAGFTHSLNVLNYYRSAAGVMPVRIDETLSDKCEQHVNYMIINKEITHHQNAAKPGYTVDGAEAGRASDLAAGVKDMEQAIDLWIHSLYHRLPLLEPSLARIGVAFSTNGGYACLYVNDTEESMRYVNYSPVAFPSAGMKNVPTTFKGNEYPDPLVGLTHQYPVGQVITLSFPFTSAVKTMSAVVTDEIGRNIPGFLRLPHDSTDQNAAVQRNTVSFIPLTPLEPNTTYTVNMKGTVDDASFSRSWSFTTGAQ